jgi:hypothetical protein
MNQNGILNLLVKEHESLIWLGYPIPEHHKGIGDIKAIVLGADPTHIVGGKPNRIKSH